jgi:hypothetical protein
LTRERRRLVILYGSEANDWIKNIQRIMVEKEHEARRERRR